MQLNKPFRNTLSRGPLGLEYVNIGIALEILVLSEENHMNLVGYLTRYLWNVDPLMFYAIL